MVGEYVALFFALVDDLGVGDDEIEPEAVQGGAGHPAEPSHGSDQGHAELVGEGLDGQVGRLVDDDPDGVAHETLVDLGVHRVQEEAAGYHGEDREEEDDSEAPADEDVPQDVDTLSLEVLRAVTIPKMLPFKDELHVGSHDGEDS